MALTKAELEFINTSKDTSSEGALTPEELEFLNTTQESQQPEKAGTAARTFLKVLQATEGDPTPYGLIKASPIGDAAESVGVGFNRPYVGSLQYATPEETKLQDSLAEYVRKSEEKIDKLPWYEGAGPAIVGELASWALPTTWAAKGLSAVSKAGAVGPRVSKYIETLLYPTTKGQKVAKAGAEGLIGYEVAEEIAPVQGETPEARRAERENRESIIAALLSGGFGSSTPFLRSGGGKIYTILAEKGLIGLTKDSRARRQASAIESKLAAQFRDFLDDSTSGSTATANEIKENMQSFMAGLEDKLKKAGVDVDTPVLTPESSPELITFFTAYYGPTKAFDMLGKKVGAESQEAFNAIIDASSERLASADSIRLGAQLLAAENDPRLVEEYTRAIRAASPEGQIIPKEGESAMTLTKRDVSTPGEVSTRAYATTRAQYDADAANVEGMYNDISRAAAGKPVGADVIAPKAQDFVDRYEPGSVERELIEAALPQKLRKLLGDSPDLEQTFSYDADLNAMRKQLQDRVDKSVAEGVADDKYAVAVRDFITDELLDTALEGLPNQQEALAAARAAYRELRQRPFVEVTPGTKSPVAAVRELQSTQPSVDQIGAGWLSMATKSPEDIRGTVKAYPQTQKDINSYYLAQLADSADAAGRVSLSKISKFAEDNKDALNLPEMAKAKAVVEDLKRAAEADGFTNLAAGVSELFTDGAFIAGLKSKSTRETLIDMAEKSGAGSNLRQGVRDYIRRSVASPADVEAGADATMSLPFLKKLSTMDRNDSDIQLITRALPEDEVDTLQATAGALYGVASAMKRTTSGTKPTTAAGEIGQLALEIGGLVMDVLNPAETTRSSALLNRIGQEERARYVLDMFMDQRKMEDFLDLVAAPTPEKFNMWVLSMAAAAGVDEGEPVTSDIPTIDNKQDSEPSYETDIYITPMSSSFNVGEDEAKPNPLVSPKTPKEHAFLAELAAKRVGVDPRLTVLFSALESSLGQRVQDNPMQIMLPTWNDLVSKVGARHDVKSGDYNKAISNYLMGAEYIKQLTTEVRNALGRTPRVHEVYMAYSMGPGGFRTWNNLREKGDTIAPVAAKLGEKNLPHKKYFYDKSGRALNYKEVETKYINHVANKAKQYQAYL